MRVLVYLITLLFVGTAVAQNPTILQGNYITNVFGQSNFVLNPNAQTNVANVTKSASAVISRNATNPLVATSDFSIYSTANGQTWDWLTRAFDKGMKNQNCEARVTYKNMQSTTTAQLLQNSLVIAQLTLSASTDPRIASINFPCGDLTYGTTFRITDSGTIPIGTPASIGGIYVGLATNQANVAQAEEYGSVTLSQCSSAWTTSGSGAQWESFPTRTNCVYSPTGKALAPSTNIPAIQFSNLPIGNYQIVISGAFGRNSATTSAVYFRARTTDGSFTSNPVIVGTTTTAQTQYSPTATFNLNITSAGSRTIEIQGFNNTTTTSSILGISGVDTTQITVYRFPSSSELVVTPERQNTFAGVKLNASGYASNSVITNTWTKLTSIGTLTRTVFGKAKVESNNDLSITIDNMPVGTFQLNVSGLFLALASAAGNTTECIFGLADSATGGGQIGIINQFSNGDTGLPTQSSSVSGLSGMYTNTSVGSRTFFVQAYRVSGGGSCYAYTDALRSITISVIPLDQPSNSALYVQGPVKAAGTGDAIASGYVFNNVYGSQYSGSFTNNTWLSLTSTTLTPGLWQVEVACTLRNNSTSTTTGWNFAAVSISDNNSDQGSDTNPHSYQYRQPSATGIGQYDVLNAKRVIYTTTTITRYLNIYSSWASGGTPTYNCQFFVMRLN